MPYVTPPSIPESTTCRALLIPDSTDWLAIFGGALTELIYKYNWEQVDGISVDDAIQAATLVINGFYEGCVASGCNQPGGYALLRVGDDGHVEQLIDGEWVEPQGENAFPAIPARTEPTANERRCLAAANAANVLQELYEQVSELAALNATAAEAILVIAAGLITRFFWIAPIINGILLIAIGILELLLQGAKYITADVWDTTFDDLIRCILYNCSSDDGGVVTFDYDCLMQALYDENVLPPWNELRVRLAAQLALLLPVVGGVDALNQMGAVDSVAEANCDDCGGECGLLITFEPEQPWQIVSFGFGQSGTNGEYDDSFGEPAPSIHTTFGTDGSSLPAMGLAVEIDLGADTYVDEVQARYYYFRNDATIIYWRVTLLDSSHADITYVDAAPTESQAEWHGLIADFSTPNVRYVQIRLAGSGGTLTDGEAWLDNVCINPPA